MSSQTTSSPPESSGGPAIWDGYCNTESSSQDSGDDITKTRHGRLEHNNGCFQSEYNNGCFQSDRWSWKDNAHGIYEGPWNWELYLPLQDLKRCWNLTLMTYQFSKQVVFVKSTHPWPEKSSDLSNLIGWCTVWNFFNEPPADDDSRLISALKLS